MMLGQVPTSVDWSQWGIAGSLVGFLVYLVIWSLMKESPRALAQSREDLKGARAEFTAALADQETKLLNTLREQRQEFTAALKEQRADFANVLKDITKENEDAINRAMERVAGRLRT